MLLRASKLQKGLKDMQTYPCTRAHVQAILTVCTYSAFMCAYRCMRRTIYTNVGIQVLRKHEWQCRLVGHSNTQSKTQTCVHTQTCARTHIIRCREVDLQNAGTHRCHSCLVRFADASRTRTHTRTHTPNAGLLSQKSSFLA
jgi:hypothetical protein